ncbi:hypothetical protein M9Y10_030845 [Tritrichomonas musculus]|uniref:NAD-dependent epimerase/dehydratase domain-containing protein n=1 Tax=Tritrichomonas musculus TaxID=1915356 RepID=A0ABR2H499_9EUKA
MSTLYLLTGATGFLGSEICAQLLKRGDDVRALVLPDDPAIEDIPEEVEIIEGDLCNIKDCQALFKVKKGTKTICIHCGGISSDRALFDKNMYETNVHGTKNMLTIARKHPECQKFVYVSNAGAIPELPKEEKIKEVSTYFPYDQDKVVGWFNRTKAMASQKVANAARLFDLNTCIVLPTGIIGPNDRAIGQSTRTIISIIKGEMKDAIDGSYNFVDVRDLAKGCILAADKGAKGESYILGNDEITLKKLCKLIENELNCETCKEFLPIEEAQEKARQMEKEAAMNGTKSTLTSFQVYNLARNNEYDYSKARRDLGYITRSYKETICDQIKWLKEQELI